MLRAIGAIVLVLAVTVVYAQTLTLEDVVRGLQSAYGRMTDMKADFSQTAFNKSLNQNIAAQGTMYLKKGGKLRW